MNTKERINMNTNEKAVVITGASTGIGKATALHLDRQGFKVFAGVRKETDAQALKQEASNKLRPILLDVTDGNSIAAAVDTIARETGGELYELVNNAGVATSAPLHAVEHSDLHFVFSVNVAGVVSVTKAFAPLIIESKGRIATTGSIAGILSGRGMGVYSMSKHAIEAFGDSLAEDLAGTGVKVSIVEPGAYKSHIRRSAVARATQEMEAAGAPPSDSRKNT